MKRWKAIATYRTHNGPVDVEHNIKELEELHDLIEAGPHWSTLVNIVITYNPPNYTGLTVEDAEKL
jgi:hypothetical protein